MVKNPRGHLLIGVFCPKPGDLSLNKDRKQQVIKVMKQHTEYDRTNRLIDRSVQLWSGYLCCCSLSPAVWMSSTESLGFIQYNKHDKLLIVQRLSLTQVLYPVLLLIWRRIRQPAVKTLSAALTGLLTVNNNN